ncbi:hypothetical protein ES703_61924 [subsurface metagenome]
MGSMEDKKLTSFQESLLVLAALSNQIEWALKAMVPKDRIEDKDLKFTISNHIQILLCSFLDERKRLEALGCDDKIRATLKMASPALDRIRRWRGLRKLRSTLLAHGHRTREGAFVWPSKVFGNHPIPTAYAEIILLGNCALLAVRVVLTQHQSDYQEAVQQLSNLKKDIEDEGIRTVGEIKEELNKIKAEILKITESYINLISMEKSLDD